MMLFIVMVSHFIDDGVVDNRRSWVRPFFPYDVTKMSVWVFMKVEILL